MSARWKWSGGVLLAAVVTAPLLMAADHFDGPHVVADPSADINDLFAWMSPDAARLNLVMTVFPSATTTSKFSDQVQYVFHTRSKAKFTDEARSESASDVICTFDTAQQIQCWASGSYVTGDASNPSGLSSSDGRIRVFAGLRDDPFFINVEGFQAMVAALAVARPQLQVDAAGCPAVNASASSAIINQLKTSLTGDPPVDALAKKNTLAIVVSVDKSLVNQGGDIISVWGSIRK